MNPVPWEELRRLHCRRLGLQSVEQARLKLGRDSANCKLSLMQGQPWHSSPHCWLFSSKNQPALQHWKFTLDAEDLGSKWKVHLDRRGTFNINT